MKRYAAQLLILLIQCFMFYLFPGFAGPTDAMGVVFLLLAATLGLSVLLGIFSGHKAKFAYPAVIAALFIPTVFMYYNESALIHALWYLAVSSVGLIIGSLIRLCLIR